MKDQRSFVCPLHKSGQHRSLAFFSDRKAIPFAFPQEMKIFLNTTAKAIISAIKLSCFFLRYDPVQRADHARRRKKNAYTLFLNMIKYKYSKCFTRVPHAVKHLFSFRRFP